MKRAASAGMVRIALGRVHPGTVMVAALAAIFILALLALISVNHSSGVDFLFSAYVRRLLISGVVQAFLSTLLSLLFGVCLALALARMRNPVLRRMAMTGLATMTALPSIVLIFAVVAVYGRSGWFAGLLAPSGLWPDGSIYGLHGILLAHVALNGPMAARLFLHALYANPAEQMRLAAVLNFSPAQVFILCDWPALKRVLPGMSALIFLLCFTSFAVVLALGGGPRNATLEVAIYEALRVEADFSRAAWLALLQIVISGAIVFLAGFSIVPPASWAGDGRSVVRADRHHAGLKVMDGLALIAAAVFIGPLLAAAVSGARLLVSLLDRDILAAVWTSTAIAVPASLFSLAMALSIAFAARHARFRLQRKGFALFHAAVPMAALAIPPFALAAGLYVLLRRTIDPALLGWIVVPLINGLSALPFVYRLLETPLMVSEDNHGRVAAHLNLAGFARFWLIDFAVVKRPLMAALALAFALSLGDFGVAALFGGAEFRTLPLLLHERLGSYRLEEAGAIASLLVLIVFGLSVVAEKLSHAAYR